MKRHQNISGKQILHLIKTGVYQFLQTVYNITYITGIQTIRIFFRVKRRILRFLYPLGDLFRRLYGRFLRRRVRFLHFAATKILKNLRWESGKFKRVRKEHGIRRALSQRKKAWQLRAVLSVAGQIALPCAAILFLLGTIWFWNGRNYGLYLSYGGTQSLVVENEGVFEQAAEMMNQRLVTDTAGETEVSLTASYRLGVVEPQRYEEVAALCDLMIQDSDDVISEASGLYVNGELTGVVRSGADLRYLLEELLEDEKESLKGESADFLESVEIVKGLFPTERIDTPNSLKNQLEDTLHVQVVREETYTEEIPYKTVTQKDSSQYTDYSKVIQEGENGEETCVDRVYYVGEEETRRESISQKTTKEPVNKIVVVGTKKRPTGEIPGEASGKFTWPSPIVRNISSYFGARWGTTHWGLDFSNGNSYGQTIVAADGGTVSYVKLQNYGYGYHLLIDHGNGYQTMYAHASKILVSAGQKVAKGQPIALIGSTGDSTGAHLHFEIIKNGSKVDPLPYLS